MKNRVQLRRLVFMAGTIVLSGSLLAEHTPLHALDLFGSKKEGKTEEQPTALRQVSQLPNFVDIAKTTMPAVVNISTTQKAPPRRDHRRHTRGHRRAKLLPPPPRHHRHRMVFLCFVLQ